MRFCPSCHQTMVKSVVSGSVMFACQFCQAPPIAGTDADTMWYSEASVDENDQYRIVIERAARDPAAKTVPFGCDRCGLQYMTLVRLGRSMRTLLVCECGAMHEYADMVAHSDEQKTKPPE